MGTRGCYGVRIDGKDYLTYNHFDSYPSVLGVDIIKEIMQEQEANGNLDKWKEKARQLQKVKHTEPPSEEEKQKCMQYYDGNVGNQSPNDWYCLLRGAQGRLAPFLDLGIIIDSSDFIRDSLFCEWAYIVNLDTDVLEVYQGYQKANHGKGRYANMPGTTPGNYPVALELTLPLEDIDPKNLTVMFPGD